MNEAGLNIGKSLNKMAENFECPLCKNEMELIETKIVADTKYKVLKCKKCHHQIARRES